MSTNHYYLDDPVNRDFIESVRKKLGGRLSGMYLYGSRARGESFLYSDYDYAIIVDRRDPWVEEQIINTATEILDRYEALISAQIFAKDEWLMEKNLPLGKNINKEGILV